MYKYWKLILMFLFKTRSSLRHFWSKQMDYHNKNNALRSIKIAILSRDEFQKINWYTQGKRNSANELYQILIMFTRNPNPTLELVGTQIQTCGLLVIWTRILRASQLPLLCLQPQAYNIFFMWFLLMKNFTSEVWVEKNDTQQDITSAEVDEFSILKKAVFFFFLTTISLKVSFLEVKIGNQMQPQVFSLKYLSVFS